MTCTITRDRWGLGWCLWVDGIYAGSARTEAEARALATRYGYGVAA